MPDAPRPDPDALLARVQASEARAKRGRLKVFFGAAAGVGKTYAMLEEARERKAEGLDVVVGWVQPHGRAETEALLQGLEVLPPRLVDHRGATLPELDLDAALARRPALLLVDELAHSNAPGSRHAKRWQDVDELLDAGIDVYSTVNVQHLESLNDVVAQITGVRVRETVPDAVLEMADDLALIDLPPDDLLQRLREGKVYLPDQAAAAMGRFFRKGNLIALRELALRRMAEQVDAQMRAYRDDHAIAQTWPAAERILVGIGPGPLNRRLIRAARQLADRLHAEWIVAYVETDAHARLPEAERARVHEALRFAESLGATVATLAGRRAAEALLDHARSRNASKIVIGKPLHPRWRDLLFGSVGDEVVRGSGAIDVYIITGEADEPAPAPLAALRPSSPWPAYARALGVMVLCTAVARLIFPWFELSNLVMTYLLGVVFVALRYGRGPSALASVLAVAAFDFFFVQPYLTFAVADTQYLVTFAVMLVVALVISSLTARLRQQALAARMRERHTAALLGLSRDLANLRGLPKLLEAAVIHIGEALDGRVLLLLPDASGALAVAAAGGGSAAGGGPVSGAELGVAEWCFAHCQMAGRSTATLPGAEALYLPLRGAQGPVGVLGLRTDAADGVTAPEQLHLLEAFADQTASAVERAHLAEEAARRRVQAETEQMRSALLSAVSHDLRTPLATITGAASLLLAGPDAAVGGPGTLDEAARRELQSAIYDEAERLNRLVGNLLEMTRLESGQVQVKRDWQPLEEVIGSALGRMERALAEHPIITTIPDDLPLAPVDGVLIEQVLINLLDNAAKHTPPSTPVALGVTAAPDALTVTVADGGPGVAPGEEAQIFERFHRAAGAVGSGSGLGLAVCRGIVQAHGGRIWAANRPGGGLEITFTLPIVGEAPTMEGAAERDLSDPRRQDA
jgi:two-component system sensor histidine kinase KdpD